MESDSSPIGVDGTPSSYLCNFLPNSYCDVKCDTENSLSVDDICTDFLSAKSPDIPDIELYLECTDDWNYTVPCSSLSPSQGQTAIIAKNVNFRVTFPTIQEDPQTGSTPWECTECGKCMTKESLRNKHLRDIHGVQKPFQCKICNYSSPNQKLLSRHYKRKHKLVNGAKQEIESQPFRPLNCKSSHLGTHLDKEITKESLELIAKMKTETTTRGTLAQPAVQEPVPIKTQHILEQSLQHIKKQTAQHNLEQRAQHNLEQTAQYNLQQTTQQNPKAELRNSNTEPNCFNDVRSTSEGNTKASGHYDISEYLVNVSSVSGVVSHTAPSTEKMAPVIVDKNKLNEGVSCVNNGQSELIETNAFQCKLCDYAGKTKKLLKIHIKTMHNSKRRIYHCELCEYTCKQKKYFEGHMRKHNGDLRFSCDVCKKCFVSETSLKRHAVCHLTRCSFVCREQLCQKVFISRPALADHKRHVHNEMHVLKGRRVRIKGVKCTIEECNRQFRDHHALKLHLCSHRGEKPLECDLCDYRCIQKNSLDWHLKTKHKCNTVTLQNQTECLDF